jgi:hypothetical protein
VDSDLSKRRWQFPAVTYALGVAGLASVVSLAVASVDQGDSQAFVIYWWRLFILPVTLVLGLFSMPLHDVARRARTRFGRFVFWAVNATAVGLLPWLALFLIGWVIESLRTAS